MFCDRMRRGTPNQNSPLASLLSHLLYHPDEQYPEPALSSNFENEWETGSWTKFSRS